MSESLPIEHGVPMPRGSGILAGKVLNTLRKLKPGDSFRLPDEISSGRVLTRAKRAGIKIATRKVNEKGWNGVRVWRIEEGEEQK